MIAFLCVFSSIAVFCALCVFRFFRFSFCARFFVRRLNNEAKSSQAIEAFLVHCTPLFLLTTSVVAFLFQRCVEQGEPLLSVVVNVAFLSVGEVLYNIFEVRTFFFLFLLAGAT